MINLFKINKNFKIIDFEEKFRDYNILTGYDLIENEIVTVLSLKTENSEKTKNFEILKNNYIKTLHFEIFPYMIYNYYEKNTKYIVVEKISSNLKKIKKRLKKFSDSTIYLIIKDVLNKFFILAKNGLKFENLKLEDIYIGEAENREKLFFLDALKISQILQNDDSLSMIINNVLNLLISMKNCRGFRDNLIEFRKSSLCTCEGLEDFSRDLIEFLDSELNLEYFCVRNNFFDWIDVPFFNFNKENNFSKNKENFGKIDIDVFLDEIDKVVNEHVGNLKAINQIFKIDNKFLKKSSSKILKSVGEDNKEKKKRCVVF